jgi:hypothetical protein
MKVNRCNRRESPSHFSTAAQPTARQFAGQRPGHLRYRGRAGHAGPGAGVAAVVVGRQRQRRLTQGLLDLKCRRRAGM